jgi:hypothetical protein
MITIKGILIDPFACTITEVEHVRGDLEDIYKHISHETMKVTCFTCAYSSALAENEAVYVDDEGLWKSPQRFFLLPGNPQPLAGKGLLLSANSRGSSASAETKLEFLQDSVFFLEPVSGVHDELRLIATVEPWAKPE